MHFIGKTVELIGPVQGDFKPTIMFKALDCIALTVNSLNQFRLIVA